VLSCEAVRLACEDGEKAGRESYVKRTKDDLFGTEEEEESAYFRDSVNDQSCFDSIFIT
jgi:hypothetical protein